MYVCLPPPPPPSAGSSNVTEQRATLFLQGVSNPINVSNIVSVHNIVLRRVAGRPCVRGTTWKSYVVYFMWCC